MNGKRPLTLNALVDLLKTNQLSLPEAKTAEAESNPILGELPPQYRNLVFPDDNSPLKDAINDFYVMPLIFVITIPRNQPASARVAHFPGCNNSAKIQRIVNGVDQDFEHLSYPQCVEQNIPLAKCCNDAAEAIGLSCMYMAAQTSKWIEEHTAQDA